MRTGIAVGLKTFSLLSVATILAACQSVQSAKPIEVATDRTTDYISAKRAYTAAMSRHLQGTEGPDSPYRLVAIVGPQWQIGTAIQADNLLNVITNNCVFPDAALPKKGVDWSDFPASSNASTISFAAGLPDSVVKALKTDSKIDASFKRVSTGQFALTSISSIIMPEDEFAKQRSSACQQVIDARDVFLVRGVISAKEVFKTGGQLAAGATLTLHTADLLKFAYDNKGDFVLEDETAKPKIYVMAYFPRKEQKDGANPLPVRAPTQTEIDRLERFQFK